jgi:ribose 5-phosphate isomerase B
MAANRYPHIRAVTVRTKQEAVMARKHNDANVLCLGADFTPKNVAFDIIDAFLKTPFDGGRHQKRLDKFNV